MKVSVIIPTYNSARFIAHSIESVLAQTFRDLEVIVIDDGSIDNTLQVLTSLNDPRVRVIRTKNQGMGAARREGLKRAQGQFIAFNDADDLWHPTKLEKQMAIMEGEPDVGVIFTDFVRFSDDGVLSQSQFNFFPELARVETVPSRCRMGRRIVGDPFTELIGFSQFPTWVQTMLFRADHVRDIRYPSNQGRVTDDMHYCFLVYQRVQVAFIEEPLVQVRRHDANSTLDLDRLEHDVRTTLCDLQQEVRHPSHLAALRQRLGRAWIVSGEVYWRQRQWLNAAKAYTRALCYKSARLRALERLVTLPLRSLPR